jgi:hypothetical protein
MTLYPFMQFIYHISSSLLILGIPGLASDILTIYVALFEMQRTLDGWINLLELRTTPPENHEVLL